MATEGVMAVTHLFAGVAVAGYDPAIAWYQRLLGRPQDVVPKRAGGAMAGSRLRMDLRDR
jgi:hypothetical protein